MMNRLMMMMLVTYICIFLFLSHYIYILTDSYSTSFSILRTRNLHHPILSHGAATPKKEEWRRVSTRLARGKKIHTGDAHDEFLDYIGIHHERQAE